MSRQICLIAYTPRADSFDRGYDQWLVDVDNPFFNSRPAVKHYSNWRVRDGATAEFPFTHFDLLVVEDGKTVDDVWSDGPLSEFAAEWVTLWGEKPGGDPAESYNIYLAEQVGGEAGEASPTMELTMKLVPTGAQWKIVKPVVGETSAEGFTLSYRLDGKATAGGVIAELIAAP